MRHIMIVLSGLVVIVTCSVSLYAAEPATKKSAEMKTDFECTSSTEPKKYYDSKALRLECAYSGGRLNGVTKEFYETGETKGEYVYKDNKLDSSKRFLRNGKLEEEMHIDEEGRKHETRIEYYPTGELFRERHLVDGKREGVEKEFYQNGKPKAERHYKEGKKEGNAKGYHINGNLQGDWEFRADEPIAATIYYSTGEKWLEHHFENGRMNGVTREYGKDGKLMAKRTYENDKLVKRVRE